MNTVAEELLAEHRNFEHVLLLMDAHTKLGDAGDPAACQFMMNALTYLLDFKGGIHNEKDRMLMERLLAADPALQPVCERLAELGKLLHETKLELQRCVAGLHAGNTALCSRVKTLIEEYRNFYTPYVELEEKEIIPAALTHLRERDWWDIHERFAQIVDPVFGGRFKPDETPYDRLMALGAGTAH